MTDILQRKILIFIAAGFLQTSFLAAASNKVNPVRGRSSKDDRTSSPPAYSTSNGVNKLIEKAVGEYQKGNSPAALKMVYEILGKYPKNQRAMDLYSQIKYDEAERLFKSAAIYFSNGEENIARSKIEEGRTLSMDVFFKFIELKILEAKSHLSKQEVIKCSKRISEVLFFDPMNVQAVKIQSFLKSNFFSEIRKSILKEKKRIAKEKLLEAKNIKANPIKSLAIVNEALALDPLNREAAKYRKYILKEAAKIDESLLQKTEKQRTADKKKAAKYFIKAENYYMEERLVKCFKYLSKAIEKDPVMEKAKKMYREVGDILCETEISKAEECFSFAQIRRAKKRIRQARFYNPQRVIKKAAALARQAQTLLKAGQKERGRDLMKLAKLFNPRHEVSSRETGKAAGEALKEIWQTYYKGDFGAAGEQMKEVEKKYPNDLDVLFLKNLISAQLSLDEGEFLPTRRYLLAAIQIKPLHQEVWSFFNRLDELLDILGYQFKKQGAE